MIIIERERVTKVGPLGGKIWTWHREREQGYRIEVTGVREPHNLIVMGSVYYSKFLEDALEGVELTGDNDFKVVGKYENKTGDSERIAVAGLLMQSAALTIISDGLVAIQLFEEAAMPALLTREWTAAAGAPGPLKGEPYEKGAAGMVGLDAIRQMSAGISDLLRGPLGANEEEGKS